MKGVDLKPASASKLPGSRKEDRLIEGRGEVYLDQTPGIDTDWDYHVEKSTCDGVR